MRTVRAGAVGGPGMQDSCNNMYSRHRQEGGRKGGGGGLWRVPCCPPSNPARSGSCSPAAAPSRQYPYKLALPSCMPPAPSASPLLLIGFAPPSRPHLRRPPAAGWLLGGGAGRPAHRGAGDGLQAGGRGGAAAAVRALGRRGEDWGQAEARAGRVGRVQWGKHCGTQACRKEGRPYRLV